MDIPRLDLNLLPIFHAVLKERSVSGAARTLKMSQPAVSTALAKLRATFNDALFVRSNVGVMPTPFAEQLGMALGGILDAIARDVLSKPLFVPETTTRCFTLSTSDIGELVFLPRLLTALKRLAPHASLRCRTMAHSQLEKAMETGEIDLALGYFPDLTGPNMVSSPLFDHPFTCLVRVGHPTIGDRLTRKQFLAADHLVVNQDGRSQEIFERIMASMTDTRRTILHIPHFLSVPALIAESDMVSIVPLTLGIVAARTQQVRYVQPPIAIPSIPLRQFWHRRMQDDPAVAWLRTVVTSEFEGRDPYISGRESGSGPN